MDLVLRVVPLALEGEWADWRAIAVVGIALLALVGSIYLLLASNLGARVGYLVLMVSLSGFAIILSLIWLVGVPGTLPGTGPRTHEPRWVPFLAESDQGREFTPVLARFPDGWEKPGTLYPGNVDSKGEIEIAKTQLQNALAALDEEQGGDATKPEDWNFRLEGTEAVTEADKELPIATVRFYQQDTPLLAAFKIGSTAKHREVTVFAFRDKGKTYLDALYFFLAGLAGFAVHLWLLGRHELRQQAREAATAPA